MKRAKGLLNKMKLTERLNFFLILNDFLGARYDLRTNNEIKNGTPLVIALILHLIFFFKIDIKLGRGNQLVNNNCFVFLLCKHSVAKCY
jgi:hypothetical protein